MGRARYNTGLFPLPDNVLPVQLFGGTSPLWRGIGGVLRLRTATSNQNIHPKPTNRTSKKHPIPRPSPKGKPITPKYLCKIQAADPNPNPPYRTALFPIQNYGACSKSRLLTIQKIRNYPYFQIEKTIIPSLLSNVPPQFYKLQGKKVRNRPFKTAP